jgi:hypothetical protein
MLSVLVPCSPSIERTALDFVVAVVGGVVVVVVVVVVAR